MNKFLLLGAMVLMSLLGFSQEKSTTIVDSYGKTQLQGPMHVEALRDTPFVSWYQANYQGYQPSEALVEKSRPLVKSMKVEVFLGTWCGDSKREVPRFMKLMDKLGVAEEQVELIAVSRADTLYKKSPSHEQQGKLVHRVPTFIVYQEGQEVGRIVEFPVTSMEMDLAQILHGLPTDPHYKVVHLLAKELLKQEISSDSSGKILELARSLYKQGMHDGELNTYGYYLMANDRLDDALIAFRVNAMLYPDVPNVYDSLGEAYAKAKKYEKAIHMYAKCLELAADNRHAQIQIAQLQEKLN